MCSRKIIFLLFILVVIFFAPNAFAATINLQNTPSEIGINDEYTVDATLSISAKDGTIYYLRGVFYAPGTTNYCGYTWNGSDWFNGPYSTNNGWQNFLAISTVNSSWSGQLKAKIDPNDTGCNTSGQYYFKIERFTSSGSSNFDTQNEQTINIIIPTATPTLLPTPTPTGTPIPPTSTHSTNSGFSTPTPKSPTPTPISKPFSTSTPFIAKSTPTLSLLPTDTSSFGAVLGTTSGGLEENKPTLVAAEKDKKVEEAQIWPIIFIIAGFCLLASCGILIALQTEKGRQLWKKFL